MEERLIEILFDGEASTYVFYFALVLLAVVIVVHVGSRTLGSYERGETLAPPDVVLEMAREYDRPDLPANYCSHMCPIGQKFAHKWQRDDLATMVLGVIKELSDVDRVKMDLISVAADGRIGADEMDSYKNAMVELVELEKAITEIKQVAARAGIDLEELVGNEKEPLAQAL